MGVSLAGVVLARGGGVGGEPVGVTGVGGEPVGVTGVGGEPVGVTGVGGEPVGVTGVGGLWVGRGAYWRGLGLKPKGMRGRG